MKRRKSLSQKAFNNSISWFNTVFLVLKFICNEIVTAFFFRNFADKI